MGSLKSMTDPQLRFMIGVYHLCLFHIQELTAKVYAARASADLINGDFEQVGGTIYRWVKRETKIHGSAWV